MQLTGHLTTYLLLMAMLISNVGGWFHVGCGGVGHSVADSSEPASSLGCCSHHCTLAIDPAHGETQRRPGTLPESVPEHDSDSCSVCQNFFASRQAILTSDEPPVWTPTLVSRIRIDRDVPSTEPIFLSGLSVRGPPRV